MTAASVTVLSTSIIMAKAQQLELALLSGYQMINWQLRRKTRPAFTHYRTHSETPESHKHSSPLQQITGQLDKSIRVLFLCFARMFFFNVIFFF